MNDDNLRVYFSELHTQFREGINIFLKASTMGLAIIGFSLGYLFKVSLEPQQSRMCSLVVFIVLMGFQFCSIHALRTYKSLRNAIKVGANQLGVPFNESNYSGFKYIVLTGMVCVLLISFIYIYLFIYPPKIMKNQKTSVVVCSQPGNQKPTSK